MRKLLLVFLALTLPLFAASPEYMIGGTVLTPAANGRTNTAVASDGTDFLVAWTDFRGNAVRTVTATRVTRGGEVLDPLGIRIASTTGGTISQGMVWDGDAYLILWTVGIYPEEGQARYDVYGARVNRDGKVVMQPRVLVEHALLSGNQALASNGTVSLAAYADQQEPFGMRAVAIDREGNVLHHEDLPMDRGSGVWDIAATPSRFVLTWNEYHGSGMRTLHVLALGSDGRVTGSPVTIGEGRSPSIATDGSRFAIVSLDEDIELRVLDSTLAQVGETAKVMDATTYPNMSILWRSGRYEVNVTDYVEEANRIDVYTTEVDADGHVVGLLQREKRGIRSATNGSEVLVLLDVPLPPSMDLQVYGALYRGNATKPEAEKLLSNSGNEHTNPVVAAGANGHLVAWNEESGAYFTRVDARGNSLDGRGMLLSAKGSGVRVAFDGTNYVAAWNEESDEKIGIRRIAPATGATVAETRFFAEAWYGFGLAATPEATFIAYANRRVFLTRIPHATNTPDLAQVAVSPKNDVQDTGVQVPSLAWNGSNLLVVWNEVQWIHSDPPYPLDVKTVAARVTGGMTLLDPAPLTIGARPGQDVVEFGPPAVASNGNDWLIVADYGTPLGTKDTYARRVRNDGTLEGTAMTRIVAGAVPAVTWNGTRYAVASKDVESVRLVEVTAAGEPDVTRQTVVATQPSLSTLSIAPTANGEAAVAYTKLSFLPQHTGVERTFLRFMDYGMPRGRGIRR